MKYLVCAVIFCFSFAQAQYEQTVKPRRIAELVDFSQYNFRQAMNDFLKNATLATLISPARVSFQSTQLFCLAPALGDYSAELAVERQIIRLHSATVPILRETLYLKACSHLVELFSVERQGLGVVPASDGDLLRGLIPGATGTDFYRLSMIDRTIKFEIGNIGTEQKLEFQMDLGGGSEIQMQIIESLADQALSHQYLRFIYQRGGRILEDVDSEYIWNLDPKYAVPRQYLYTKQKEISPGDFLKFQNSVYAQTFNPLIENQLKFYQTGH